MSSVFYHNERKEIAELSENDWTIQEAKSGLQLEDLGRSAVTNTVEMEETEAEE